MSDNYNKKFLISGIPPSSSGVGRLMKQLVPEAEKRGYNLLTKKKGLDVKSFNFKNRYLNAGINFLLELLHVIIFNIKINFINNSVIIFIHPQTAGFKNLIKALKKRNKVYLYVVDNSFFCIRSRNVNPITEKECLKCLGNLDNVLKSCKPLPVKYSKSTNISFLKMIKEHSDKIVFLAQNKNQVKLIANHFGDKTKIKVVGLDTGELNEQHKTLNNKILKFDFVFHGSVHIAKGIRYFVDIAEKLPNKKFFIPAERKTCEELLKRKKFSQNIIFKKCTWETGLKEVLSSSKFAFNPSIWSAPIEGALIKSLKYNGNVITVKSEFGFENELSREAEILRLSSNPIKGANELIKFLSNERTLSVNKNHKWIEKYRQENSVERVFDCVEKTLYS